MCGCVRCSSVSSDVVAAGLTALIAIMVPDMVVREEKFERKKS